MTTETMADKDLAASIVEVLSDGRELNVTQLLEALYDVGIGVSLGEAYSQIKRLVAEGRLETREAWIAGDSGLVSRRRLVRLVGAPFASQEELQQRVQIETLEAEARTEIVRAPALQPERVERKPIPYWFSCLVVIAFAVVAVWVLRFLHAFEGSDIVIMAGICIVAFCLALGFGYISSKDEPKR